MRQHTTEELLRGAILRSPSIKSTTMKLWTHAESSGDTPKLVLEIPFDNATRAAAFSALPPCDDGARRRKLASRWGLPHLGLARLPSDEWWGWGYGDAWGHLYLHKRFTVEEIGTTWTWVCWEFVVSEKGWGRRWTDRPTWRQHRIDTRVTTFHECASAAGSELGQ
jgi:hypothetical protein